MENMSFLQKLFGKETNGKKNNWLFIIGLAGILLIFLSGLLPTGKKAAEKTQQTAVQSEAEYIKQLETKLTSILKKTEGVGEVEVMITLESSASLIYAQNEESDTETDNSSAQQQSLKSAYKTEHVLIENSGEKAPLIETSIAPEVKGVAVVCTGGGDISVITNVTELVSALLALPTNRICVTKMI